MTGRQQAKLSHLKINYLPLVVTVSKSGLGSSTCLLDVANRYTTIKGLTEGQLGAEVVKGIIEQIQCVGHLQLHGLVIYTVGPTAEVLLFWKTMPCYDGPGFYSTANLK